VLPFYILILPRLLTAAPLTILSATEITNYHDLYCIKWICSFPVHRSHRKIQWSRSWDKACMPDKVFQYVDNGSAKQIFFTRRSEKPGIIRYYSRLLYMNCMVDSHSLWRNKVSSIPENHEFPIGHYARYKQKLSQFPFLFIDAFIPDILLLFIIWHVPPSGSPKIYRIISSYISIWFFWEINPIRIATLNRRIVNYGSGSWTTLRLFSPFYQHIRYW